MLLHSGSTVLLLAPAPNVYICSREAPWSLIHVPGMGTGRLAVRVAWPVTMYMYVHA